MEIKAKVYTIVQDRVDLFRKIARTYDFLIDREHEYNMVIVEIWV